MRLKRLILPSLVVYLAASLAARFAVGQQEPVWSFNPGDTFLDIACKDDERAVIVGDRGRLLVTHGKYPNLWSPRDAKTKEMLTAVSFIDPEYGWAVGHGGVIIHSQDGGNSWQVQRESSAENLPLFDIQFVSREVGYASGAYDTLLKTRDGGETWDSLFTGSDNIYNGLYFHDSDNGFLLGEFGSMLRTSDGGESWRQVDIGGYQGSLFGMTFLSTEMALAYGINGKLMISRDSGETWADIATGTEEALYRAASYGDQVVIVGKSGVYLLSRDGADSFIKKTDADNYSFGGICARSGGGFVAVGEFGRIMAIETLPDE